ncbi:MAG TPA: hypothetical protein VF173_33745 [Thermoanaerobaculia bacterium]|nr:hypothetical protein [Thermoanaerobaculia bacterium]
MSKRTLELVVAAIAAATLGVTAIGVTFITGIPAKLNLFLCFTGAVSFAATVVLILLVFTPIFERLREKRRAKAAAVKRQEEQEELRRTWALPLQAWLKFHYYVVRVRQLFESEREAVTEASWSEFIKALESAKIEAARLLPEEQKSAAYYLELLSKLTRETRNQGILAWIDLGDWVTNRNIKYMGIQRAADLPAIDWQAEWKKEEAAAASRATTKKPIRGRKA